MKDKRILIVDDEPDILRLTLLRLKKSGFEVITALNGSDAIVVAGREKPDLILLDMVLPKMNGSQVCRYLKNHNELSHIPVILFTASSNTMTAIRAKKIGADDFIVKPFDPDVLIAKIDDALMVRRE